MTLPQVGVISTKLGQLALQLGSAQPATEGGLRYANLGRY